LQNRERKTRTQVSKNRHSGINYTRKNLWQGKVIGKQWFSGCGIPKKRQPGVWRG